MKGSKIVSEFIIWLGAIEEKLKYLRMHALADRGGTE